MFCKRAERAADDSLHCFVKGVVGKILRSPRITELAGAIGHFGGTCKADFQDKIKDKPCLIAYDNIVSNRQLIAHDSGANMTFAELEAAVADCDLIFDAIGTAIGLSEDELASL